MPGSRSMSEALAEVRPKAKEPRSKGVLDSWIAHVEAEVDPSRSGRVAWIVASTVATAKLQGVLDEQGKPSFSLKGGTLLQHRLGLASRATRDLDGIVRGDLDSFLARFDDSSSEGWGPIGFSRSEVEIINTPSKSVKPRRFTMFLSVRGQVWRKVVVEISPDEGMAGSTQERFPAPSLAPFGIPTPDFLVGMAMSYQIAQKLHAATDPHNPPEYVNRRARDLVDLILIRELVEADGSPSPADIRAAVEDVFAARAADARLLGRIPRVLPAKIKVLDHWGSDYRDAAASCGVDLSPQEAADLINGWMAGILDC